MSLLRIRVVAALLLTCAARLAAADPTSVEHTPGAGVFGEAADVTMREPEIPREDEVVDLWVRVSFQFSYDRVAIYYTTDGSTPSGAFGTPSGSTQVLSNSGGSISFVRNEFAGGTRDWWKATLPAGARQYAQTIRYKISAWQSFSPNEIFANGGSAYTFTNKLAWPGRGAGYAQPGAGYPPVSHWKEEGVVGNNYINVMLDQNGTVYDIYYPSAGGVQGMGTKNEGYVDGLDTFPPGLPLGARGQMNLNQAMGGIRVDGVTYWLSNENAVGYSNVSQAYIEDTNVIYTAATLTAGGNNILVEQYDFSPKGVVFPLDQGGNPNPGIYLKRCILTNNGSSAETVNFYFYGDFALNGGDGYDFMFADAGRGAMIAYDNTQRYTSASGEYNPTTFGDYEKDVSVYLASALKTIGTVGGSGGAAAPDSWRDTSADNDQGWIGAQVQIPAGQSRELDLCIAGGFDGFSGASGTYSFQVAPVLDWFLSGNVSTWQSQTETYWQDWLDQGVTIDLPDDDYDWLYNRSLLATALHLDAEGGGLIAGMHNGAYPYVWPRDAVYGAVSLSRTGHTAEAEEIYRFLRDVAYRANDAWGKGFWYQKYTTDGYIVWSAPQVDETAVVPWGIYYLYLVTGDAGLLSDYYTIVYEAGRASSEDSSIDIRLYYDDTFQLMHGNNVWEDSFALFIYSNANVIRGLRDAASIATLLGHGSDASLFTGRAGAIQSGLEARLDWNGENTDISQLGITYPFNVIPANHARAQLVLNRVKGAAANTFGQFQPLLRTSGEWTGLVDRYWGDTYWNGGPWFLSTLWYGLFHAELQDFQPGKSAIDVHKDKLDRLIDRLGPIGLGAEQIAPSNSLLYPGQTDFVLQAAWPNAWESMSTFVDSVMYFLDYTPDTPNNTLRIEPKLPTGWSTMTFRNLAVGNRRIDVTCAESTVGSTHTFTNITGGSANFDTYVRIPAGKQIASVSRNGVPIAYVHDPATGRVRVQGSLATGMNSTTAVFVRFKTPFNAGTPGQAGQAGGTASFDGGEVTGNTGP